MRKLILMTTCAVLATSQILLAADADPNKAQSDKIKALRTALLNKIPALTDVFDGEHNGVNAAWAPVSAAYPEAVAKLNKLIQEESAKAADAQDKTAIAGWQAKIARFQTHWGERNAKTWPAWSAKFNALNTVRMTLAGLITNQTNQDQIWIRAECDRGVFISVLTELDKQVDEIQTQANALVAESIKMSEEDLRLFKE